MEAINGVFIGLVAFVLISGAIGLALDLAPEVESAAPDPAAAPGRLPNSYHVPDVCKMPPCAALERPPGQYVETRRVLNPPSSPSPTPSASVAIASPTPLVVAAVTPAEAKHGSDHPSAEHSKRDEKKAGHADKEEKPGWLLRKLPKIELDRDRADSESDSSKRSESKKGGKHKR